MSQLPGFAATCRALAFQFLMLSWGSLAHAQGAFTIDIPGATFTRVLGLNAQGDVCGGTLLNGERLAFAGSRQADFNNLTMFAYPGSVFTQCRGINSAGQMVGGYQSADNVFHAFVKDGPEFFSFDVPGAINTVASGIDPLGQIVGRYTRSDNTIHGFSGAATGRSSPSTRLEPTKPRPRESRHRVTSPACTGLWTEHFTASFSRRTDSRRSTFRAPCIRGARVEACGCRPPVS